MCGRSRSDASNGRSASSRVRRRGGQDRVETSFCEGANDEIAHPCNYSALAKERVRRKGVAGVDVPAERTAPTDRVIAPPCGTTAYPCNYSVSVQLLGIRATTRYPCNYSVSVQQLGIRATTRYPCNDSVSVQKLPPGKPGKPGGRWGAQRQAALARSNDAQRGRRTEHGGGWQGVSQTRRACGRGTPSSSRIRSLPARPYFRPFFYAPSHSRPAVTTAAPGSPSIAAGVAHSPGRLLVRVRLLLHRNFVGAFADHR